MSALSTITSTSTTCLQCVGIPSDPFKGYIYIRGRWVIPAPERNAQPDIHEVLNDQCECILQFVEHTLWLPAVGKISVYQAKSWSGGGSGINFSLKFNTWLCKHPEVCKPPLGLQTTPWFANHPLVCKLPCDYQLWERSLFIILTHEVVVVLETTLVWNLTLGFVNTQRFANHPLVCKLPLGLQTTPWFANFALMCANKVLKLWM